jgi:hypothetical protein
MVTVNAVRRAVGTGGDITSAVKQLGSAVKQVPQGSLSLDLAQAAYELGQFDERAALGQPAGKWAREYAGTMAKITRECQPS